MAPCSPRPLRRCGIAAAAWVAGATTATLLFITLAVQLHSASASSCSSRYPDASYYTPGVRVSSRGGGYVILGIRASEGQASTPRYIQDRYYSRNSKYTKNGKLIYTSAVSINNKLQFNDNGRWEVLVAERKVAEMWPARGSPEIHPQTWRVLNTVTNRWEWAGCPSQHLLTGTSGCNHRDVCTRKLYGQEFCQDNKQCRSNNCACPTDGNSCADGKLTRCTGPRLPAGYPCTESNECESRRCYGPSTMPYGAEGFCCGAKGMSVGCVRCDKQGNCASCAPSYALENGQCVALKNEGESCINDSYCKSAMFCRAGQCVKGQPKGDGDACLYNGNCDTEICLGNTCCSASLWNSWCRECGAPDGACRLCEPGYVLLSNGQCGKKRPGGGGCTSGSECESGTCLDGVCCKDAATGCKKCSSSIGAVAGGGGGSGVCTECLDSHYLNATLGICHGKRITGGRCAIDGACLSDTCRSGRCCKGSGQTLCASCNSEGLCASCTPPLVLRGLQCVRAAITTTTTTTTTTVSGAAPAGGSTSEKDDDPGKYFLFCCFYFFLFFLLWLFFFFFGGREARGGYTFFYLQFFFTQRNT